MGFKQEDYEVWLGTREGQDALIRTMDKARELSKVAGAFTRNRLGGSPDAWQALAVVNRLVERGELKRVEMVGVTSGAWDSDIFVWTGPS
jgi:hypothetical protein